MRTIFYYMLAGIALVGVSCTGHKEKSEKEEKKEVKAIEKFSKV